MGLLIPIPAGEHEVFMSASSLMSHMAYDVFISHKSEYKAWVEVLAQNLRHVATVSFLTSGNSCPDKAWWMSCTGAYNNPAPGFWWSRQRHGSRAGSEKNIVR
jgi:hypothetical protein